MGRFPGGGHGNPLQYSCQENPHGQRGLACCSPWGHKESDTNERLSMHIHTHEPYLVKFQLHRFPLNDYLELNILPLPLFRRKEMDIHSAMIRARCGSGGPHWACFKPAVTLPADSMLLSVSGPPLWPVGRCGQRPSLVPSHPSVLYVGSHHLRKASPRPQSVLAAPPSLAHSLP